MSFTEQCVNNASDIEVGILNSMEDSHLKQPFFKTNNVVLLNDKNRPKNLSNDSINKMNLNTFPSELRQLYLDILQDEMTEITINGWNFLCLKEFFDRTQYYQNIYDIATYYHGMGYVLVLSYDKKSSSYFVRLDGGSNGYDREAHFNYYESLDTDTINNSYKYDDINSIISLENDAFPYISPQ